MRRSYVNKDVSGINIMMTLLLLAQAGELIRQQSGIDSCRAGECGKFTAWLSYCMLIHVIRCTAC